MRSVYFLVLAAVYMSATAQLAFQYVRQENWTGICNTGAAIRSPINIVTADVQESEELIPLEFDHRWMASLDGEFTNTGVVVRFTDYGERAMVCNHLGDYELVQFHLHWGTIDGTGHQINGVQFAVEFHFVTLRIGSGIEFTDNHFTNVGPDSPRDGIAVISVLAEVNDSMPISGVWRLLDPSTLLNASDSINVTGLSYSMILPDNRDYYYYPGAQTSPGCFEIVEFFVMKETIQVPSAYLDLLQSIRFDSGELMLSNRRNVQPILENTVLTLGSVGQAASVLVLGGSALLVCLYNLL